MKYLYSMLLDNKISECYELLRSLSKSDESFSTGNFTIMLIKLPNIVNYELAKGEISRNIMNMALKLMMILLE